MIATARPAFGFTGGVFGFHIAGPANQSVVIDVSTNLVNWLPIWTNVIGGGSLSFTDQQSVIDSKRFYRARTP